MNMNFAEQIDLLYSLICATNVASNNRNKTVVELLKTIKKETNDIFYEIDKINLDDENFNISIDKLTSLTRAYTFIKTAIDTGNIDYDLEVSDLLEMFAIMSIDMIDDSLHIISNMYKTLGLLEE